MKKYWVLFSLTNNLIFAIIFHQKSEILPSIMLFFYFKTKKEAIMIKKLTIPSLVIFYLFISAFILPQAAYSATHELYIPYNVKESNWWTGWHIMPIGATGDEIFSFYFTSNGLHFASFSATIPRGGWTGTVDNLLSLVGFDPSTFVSPALIQIYTDSGAFTVTQFIGNSSSSSPGFAFQTFYSWPVTKAWPYTP